MIDLAALKEQLRLLGHDLPDAQVVAILKEMNIDFDATGDSSDPVQATRGSAYKDAGTRGEEIALRGAPRSGSILDNFQGRPPPPSQAAHVAVGPPEAVAPQSFSYGYTSPAHGAAAGLNHGKVAGRGLTPQTGSPPGRKRSAGPGGSRREYSGDCYDYDSDDLDEEPGISCRYCETEEVRPSAAAGANACTHQSVHKAWPEGTSGSGQAIGRPSSDAGPSGLADRFGRASLNEPPVRGGQQASAAGKGPAMPSSAAGVQQPGSATAANDQHHKAHGVRIAPPKDQGRRATSLYEDSKGYDDEDEEEECDVAVSDPDKDPQQARQRQPPWPRSAQDPYAAWLGDRGDPLVAHLAGALLAQDPLSPQGSSRSVASRATTRCSTGSKRGGGAKKVDRVQRYQQLQQEWSQNRFLKQANGTSRGTSRKPVNFHSHFASLHAAEEAERQRVLREARAKTKKELGAATEAPTANRRDELRWQTRMRLKTQI